MELSAFSIVDEYAEDVARGRDRLGEVVALAEAADRAALHAAWVAEHHFHEGGVCPSPPVLLGAIGARTQRIRVGAMVSVLPFHRSVDVAEEYAMVDRLSGGRLNLGVGSGYIGLEFEGFGVDPATKRERFEESLAQLLAAFRGEPMSAGGPGVAPVPLNVRPVQQPSPPIWIAVQRREAIPFVARRRANLALIPYATISGLDELSEEIRDYRAALPAGYSGRVSVGLHVYAGNHVAEARRALQRFLDSRLKTQSKFYVEKVAKDPRHASAETLESSGWALFGSGEDVVQRLAAFRAAGVDEVLGIFDFGGLAQERVADSVRDLGRAFYRR